MSTITVTVRQGDILFIRRDRVPAKSSRVADGVIARGTATGHTHALRESPKVRLVRDSNGTMFVVVARGSEGSIDHQEHATVTLSHGTWEIRRQSEETPEGLRRVED
jgi:hypothetical protein